MTWAVGAAVAIATAVCALAFMRGKGEGSAPIKSFKGQVVWITGASSGIGEGAYVRNSTMQTRHGGSTR